MKKAALTAVNYYLPAEELSNQKLSEQFPEWDVEKIAAKTGIATRRIAAAGESVGDMAISAAKKLFSSCSVGPDDIDFILLCTQSPDYALPTTACVIQHELGVPTTAGALDFNLGCSGYVYGLSLAKGLVETGQASRVLLLTSEAYSRYLNEKDKSVRTIFGDAASASIVELVDGDEDLVGAFEFGSNGEGAGNLIVPHGGSRRPLSEASYIDATELDGNTRSPSNLYMNGPEILTFTLKSVRDAYNSVLDKAGLTIDEVDWVVFHQANGFMLERLRKQLKIPEEKFLTSFSHCGNTVSSTIPIVISDFSSQGRIRFGDRVLAVGFGVGYSWAGAMLVWSGDSL